ncbi:hypothetical protein K438DRAFT_2115308 [Mycena galopus ATCC 62051]|nr:hypothetical protein K438DRAFT_2115308 [Mycena galopus ATCC 62051]
MSYFNILALVSLFSFLVLDALAQSSDDTGVTLWQFGINRLAGGEVTLPLEPLQTVSDGSATMYRYQVLNPTTVVAVVDSTFTRQTIAATATRTIIASASGWAEIFGSNENLACGFIDSTFGECFMGTATAPANSGAPQTVRIAVATQTPAPTLPSGSTTPVKPSMRPIVGGAAAGSLVVLVLALIILFLRRRRRQLQEIEKTVAVGYERTAPQHSTLSGKALPFAGFAAGPQLELGLGNDANGAGQPPVPFHSHSTPHSVSLVVQSDEPPAYSGQTLSPTTAQAAVAAVYVPVHKAVLANRIAFGVLKAPMVSV